MILLIDCYDSFSYNLTHLIELACNTSVEVVHHDKLSITELTKHLPGIGAIVIGPGPGNPQKPEDRGIIDDVWALVKQNPVPVLGVCFGYQSMMLAFGGQVRCLENPQHGRVAKIEHTPDSVLFNGIPPEFKVVRYHSLYIDSARGSDLNITARAANDNVEMAAEHPFLPWFGVQFHPESVLSTYGVNILQNFWAASTKFNQLYREMQPAAPFPKEMTVTYESLMPAKTTQNSSSAELTILECPPTSWQSIASLLDEFVCLKSASTPGEWTIFGIIEPHVTPHIRSKNGKVFEGPLHDTAPVVGTNVWEYAAQFMASRMISQEQAREVNKPDLPFLGGIVGYVTYEGGCLHTVNGGVPEESGMHSDVSLVYVTKSITVNEETKKMYITGPLEWAREMHNKCPRMETTSDYVHHPIGTPAINNRIDFRRYKHLIDECFVKLRIGDSYELCLTTQAELDFGSAINPWQLFQHMVHHNPAPYCSYMSFDDRLIATSPERFMKWDYSGCEFRPIKGTVRKSANMTREKATEILKTEKEQAENLMIVDLIRHDVGHLLSKVTTPQLMTVEEYHSVYQLVTSIEGKFTNSMRGIDVLYQSLPPGSMTGAPKQRSCDILKALESAPRGLYSGVQGYWSIDDRGDWSVIIRSLFQAKQEHQKWRLGAGGAITVLSTAKGEYEEMGTKMSSVLAAFE